LRICFYLRSVGARASERERERERERELKEKSPFLFKSRDLFFSSKVETLFEQGEAAMAPTGRPAASCRTRAVELNMLNPPETLIRNP
jgi:hypothetical protein